MQTIERLVSWERAHTAKPRQALHPISDQCWSLDIRPNSHKMSEKKKKKRSKGHYQIDNLLRDMCWCQVTDQQEGQHVRIGKWGHHKERCFLLAQQVDGKKEKPIKQEAETVKYDMTWSAARLDSTIDLFSFLFLYITLLSTSSSRTEQTREKLWYQTCIQ